MIRDYFQNDAKIMTELDNIGFENLAINVITIGEVYYGMKKREKRKTQNGLIALDCFISIKKYP